MILFRRRLRKEEGGEESFEDLGKVYAPTPYGPLLSGDGFLEPYATDLSSAFRELAPLFYVEGAQEVFLRARDSDVKGVLTIRGRRFAIKAECKFERVVEEIVARTGVPLSLAKPSAITEIEGWRVELKMPLIAAAWELNATKLLPPPPLREYGSLIAARLLTLALTPLPILVTGAPGSGKSTLVNSILVEVARLYPQLRILLIERVRELYIPSGAVNIGVRVGEELGLHLREALRWARPDMVVVGEIRAEDVDFIDASRAGVPLSSTIHAPSARRALEAMSYHARRILGFITPRELSRLIPVHVEMFKRVSKVIERGVSSILVSDGQKLLIISSGDEHCGDRLFENLLSPWSTVTGVDAVSFYHEAMEMFGAERGVGWRALGYVSLD